MDTSGIVFRVDDLPERMRSRIAIDAESGCWIWTGAKRGGYGKVQVARKMRSLHRLAYELLVGPIPAGLQIDHVKKRGCTSTACCNPAHLEPVTHKENVLRGIAPPAQNARKTHCAKGHAFSGANLCTRPNGRRECVTCRRAANAAWQRAHPGRDKERNARYYAQNRVRVRARQRARRIALKAAR